MQSVGKHVFHVLELLCTMYLCPILRTALIRKTASKSVIFLCQIFLLIFIIYLTRQNAFLVFFNPIVNVWPSQMWMNKLLGVSACYRLGFTRSTWIPHHHPSALRAGALNYFITVPGKNSLMSQSGYASFTSDAAL